MKNYKFILKNLDCANCAKKIEDKVSAENGYKNVNVNFSTSKINFSTSKTGDVKKDVTKIVKSIEPDVDVLEENAEQDTERNSKDIFRLIIGIAIYLIGVISNAGMWVRLICTTVALIILLFKTAKKACKQLVKNNVLDENTLITISCIGALSIGKGMEAVMVIFLYEIGKLLEAKAINKTRKSITDLMNIKPEYANLKIGEYLKKVEPENVKVGEIITVKAGEKIPLDGVVLTGNAELDNSALTGESKLVKVQKDSKVLSGSINVQGLIEVKVTKTYENSTVSQILNLVENATDKKAKTETFVSKAAKIYTPIVLGLAVLVLIFMPMIFTDVTYKDSLYKALIFLVISCPCSIAISVPLSYFTGIGKASKRGILIKGSDYLDGIKDIDTIIFDKTGTITTGRFVVSKIDILEDNYSVHDILKYFSIGESFSNHPIAESIVKRAKEDNIEIDTTNVKNFEEVSGKGIKYEIDGHKIKVGNSDFVETKKDQDIASTILYLKIDDRIVGRVIIDDEIKKDAKSTIAKLSKAGINTKMFTGDKKEVALKISKEVGINETKFEMLPQNKYSELEEVLRTNKTDKKVAYVGDGINDSPVLARADIGISMGGIGSSSAIEASDIVIMTDELNKIVESIDISKKTNMIIKQNLIFSIGVKLIILVLNILGYANMWEAVFGDVGVTLITVLNTVRILK